MNRLAVRLTMAILLVTWIVLAIVAYVVNQSVDASFRQYVGARNSAIFDAALIGELQSYYAANGAWAGADALLPVAGRGMGERRGHGGMQAYVAAPDGTIMAATDESWLGRRIDDIAAAQTVPLEVNGVSVGMLGQQTPAAGALGRAEQAFTDQVGQSLLAIGLLATLVALALGLLLAYWLARPIQRLAERIGRLTSAQLGEPVPVEGSSEVRQLATSFNAMSRRLADGERLRRQMTSDIAHELRTPISVLRGHLEAMMDGVYPLDVERLAVGYDQTLHLARLVEDLRLLTQAEAGRLPLQLAATGPASLVEEAAARFDPLAQDAGILLQNEIAPRLPEVEVDVGRMQQVFDNLLTNALRHTARGGTIRITAEQAPLHALAQLPTCSGSYVRFNVSNSGDLPPAHIEHIFDRFWRGEDARQSDSSGSGLGLAITRQLVLLHRGSIAAHSAGGMTTFCVDLPAHIVPA
jgi:signal transduction histidine kinase